jgi:hypothetical protein
LLGGAQLAWITGAALPNASALAREWDPLAIVEMDRLRSARGCTHACVSLAADGGRWSDAACDTRRACVCQAGGVPSRQYAAAVPRLRRAETLPQGCEASPIRAASSLLQEPRRRKAALGLVDDVWYLSGKQVKVCPRRPTLMHGVSTTSPVLPRGVGVCP